MTRVGILQGYRNQDLRSSLMGHFAPMQTLPYLYRFVKEYTQIYASLDYNCHAICQIQTTETSVACCSIDLLKCYG